MGLLFGVSCDEDSTSTTAKFIGDFTQESVGYIAANHSGGTNWLQTLFSPTEALALPNLSIPDDEFTGPAPVPFDTRINILGLDGAFITTGTTDGAGHIEVIAEPARDDSGSAGQDVRLELHQQRRGPVDVRHYLGQGGLDVG